MTTFTELQCFNKLLLKKLERTLKEKEVLMKETIVASSRENQYLSLRTKYRSLVRLMANVGALDDIFECRQCGEWQHDDEAVMNDSGNCDCGYICKDCEEEWKTHWVCDGCEASFCRSCDEEAGEIHKHGLHIFCDECIEDVEEVQKYQYHIVMKELIKKFAHSGI